MESAKVNFEVLSKLLRDNKEAIRKALELFLETTIEDMGRLAVYIKETKFAEASRIAHSLKSRFIYLGNEEVSALIKSLEGLLKDGRMTNQDEIERLFQSMNQLISICLEEVRSQLMVNGY